MEAHIFPWPIAMTTLLFGSTILGGYITYHRYQIRRSKLPPGPPGLPFAGNIFDIPKQNEGRYYRELGAQLGKLKRPSLTVPALALRYLNIDVGVC